MALGATASTIRDRTPEFLSTVQHLVPTAPSVPSKSLRSPFTTLASNVASKIQETSVRLGKLTNLAARRSLFDDPTAEIQQLTLAIKRDINQLNTHMEELSRLRDMQQRRANKQTGDHTASVVYSLKGRLMNTAEGFKKVMKMREDSLAAQRDRRAHFLGSTSTALDLGTGSLGANLHQQQPQSQGQVLALQNKPQDQSYQIARADAVKQVESTVVELEQIFNQLATMVSEQGELVERIDANVEDTVSNMHAGHAQLIRYFNSISSNRALILKVFAVLLCFVIVWSLLA